MSDNFEALCINFFCRQSLADVTKIKLKFRGAICKSCIKFTFVRFTKSVIFTAKTKQTKTKRKQKKKEKKQNKPEKKQKTKNELIKNKQTTNKQKITGTIMLL